MAGMTAREDLVLDEAVRQREFPVVGERLFMAHAGVAPLPRRAGDALRHFADYGSRDHQESGDIGKRIERARERAGELLGCRSGEIALLGPTALGLNLVANGLDWRDGDEVVYYPDDYPANVYPWTKLRIRGVKPVALQPGAPGRITWELVEGALTKRTRLVALASCHFLSGYRIDIDGIGRNLRERQVLFCLDGIQSLGAFPLSTDHVDFLSADSHKWLLGPLGAGILYVREELQEACSPTLLGAWNVKSPDFVAQENLNYYDGARRYEPGALNVPGILAMSASMELLLEFGVESVGRRILILRGLIVEGAETLGYRCYGETSGPLPPPDNSARSGIISLEHCERDMERLYRRLLEENITLSLRRDRTGRSFLRVSPHFYNTRSEVEQLLEALSR